MPRGLDGSDVTRQELLNEVGTVSRDESDPSGLLVGIDDTEETHELDGVRGGANFDSDRVAKTYGTLSVLDCGVTMEDSPRKNSTWAPVIDRVRSPIHCRRALVLEYFWP